MLIKVLGSGAGGGLPQWNCNCANCMQARAFANGFKPRTQSSIAVSEIEFYTGNLFPKWKNNLFIGSLAQQKFLRLEITGDKVVHSEEVFHGLGRVRDIKTGPDGNIYIALELIGKLGRIVRLVPAD